MREVSIFLKCQFDMLFNLTCGLIMAVLLNIGSIAAAKIATGEQIKNMVMTVEVGKQLICWHFAYWR
ncbi:hypothetical protein [Endozoicomonas sp.]|uniref:hypothetical protein n=1 Tax=Endozoicomonas sp. TaxID=1892382 RepID=UPI003AF52A06